MAPTFVTPSFVKRSKSATHQVAPLTKQTIKYLSVVKNPHARNEAIRSAGPEVFKKLSDFALNAAQGDVQFTPDQKRKLAKYRKQIGTLASNKVSTTQKKKLLLQKGSGIGAILGLVLPTVISALGSAIFSKRE